MTEADLVTTLEWARDEGWNPGLGDAPLFRAADPEGFLVTTDPDGAPAASISIVRVGPAHFFLGLFICRADLRGQGYAGPLWHAAMERAGEASIGLDGVVAEQPRYADRGFRATHRTIRHGGHLAVDLPQGGSRSVTSDNLSAILSMDQAATGFARDDFLRAWAAPAPDRHVRVVDGPDGLRAMGVMRICHEGWKIGPLHAADPEAAALVLVDLASLSEGRSVMIDTPEDNPGAIALARRAGLSPVFETARMWKGPPPERRSGWEYGSATLELG